MMHIKLFIKWLVILGVVLAGAFCVYAAVKISKPQTTDGAEKIFSIPTGWTTGQIAQSLEAEGLINRAFFFKLYIYLKNAGENIQAGKYALSPGMSIRQIARRLVVGEVINDAVRLIVLEGWTQKEIADELANSGIISAAEFNAATNPSPIEGGISVYSEFDFLNDIPRGYGLEGYLFPDTYLISKTATGRDIVQKLLQNFDKKVSPELRREVARQGKTLYEIVTLASIVEKEVGRNVEKGERLKEPEMAKLQEERRLVAGVFYNRLAAGIRLESDATVTYITGRNDSRATIEETKIDSPYNTYKYAGLPPGPICNPSLDAILAVINPAKSDYLFFLTSPDGTAHFASTLDEHIQNRTKYLE